MRDEDLEARRHGLVQVVMTPVTGQRGVESLAQPVDEGRLPKLRQHATVDARVIFWSARDARELAAGHDHDLAALVFDETALLLIGGFDIAEGAGGPRLEVVGLRAAHDPTADCPGLRDRALDQLLGGVPVEAHSALRRVHRLGDAQPVAPDVAAERKGAFPVDHRGRERADVGERVGDHVDRCVGDSGAGRDAAGGIQELSLYGVVVDGAAASRQPHPLTHRQTSSCTRISAISSGAYPSSVSTSSVCSPSSGGGRRKVASPELYRTGCLRTRTRPARGWSNSRTGAMCLTATSSNVSARFLTGAHQMSWARSRSTQSAVVRVRKKGSRAARISSRLLKAIAG